MTLLEALIERATDEGCHGEEPGAHSESCAEYWRSEPERWCDYCLIGNAAQLIEKVVEHRESAFNAGFDQSVKATTPTEVLRQINFRHPQYLKDRRREFEKWQAANG